MKQTNVPDGWKEVKLGDIAEISQGYTFKPEYQGFPNEKWNYFKVADIGLLTNHKYLYHAINTIPDKTLSVMKRALFKKGSIVFPRVGAALKNNNKKILSCDSLIDDNTLALTVTDITTDSEFIYYVFETKDLSTFCNDGTVPVINAGNVLKQGILLPPLAEQKEIAGTLSVWDNMIEKMEQLIARKEEKRIWLSNKLIANNLNRKTWKQIKLKEILHEGSKIPVSDTNLYNKITIKLHKNGLCFSDNTREMADTRPFYVRHTGELIIGKQNYFNGSIALVDKQFDGAICSNAIMSFVISDEVDKNFLYEAISYNSYLEKHAALANGTGQKELSENDFLNFEILIPSINEQHKIADLISSDQKEIDIQKQLVAQYKLQKQGLMQKLLTGQWRIK